MLPEAHLTSHSRMSGSRWVTTPSWLSRSLRPLFLYSSSVCSCYLFLISSSSFGSILFLSFIVPIFTWDYHWVEKTFQNILINCPKLKHKCNFGHWLTLYEMYFNWNNYLTPKNIEIFNYIKLIFITVSIAIIVCIYIHCVQLVLNISLYSWLSYLISSIWYQCVLKT